MSHDDHDLCGSFCECGPEVTPMTATEMAEYRAETARLRAANVARVQQDAESMAARDSVVRAAIQAIRDTDHAAALLEGSRRHSFLPTMGHGPAYGPCQLIGCGRPYSDASTHTRTVLTATGVVTR